MSGMEMMEALSGVSFLIGDKETVEALSNTPAIEPFAEEMLDMLNDVARLLMADKEARQYPDVITYAFWIRKSSALKLKERFQKEDGNIHLGRGIAFHIAPSNVSVNYAYSLAAGLLTGNANIVRVPTKEFPQINVINKAFAAALGKEQHAKLKPYVCLVRYGREKAINDLFSSLSDTRIIWGGNDTIAEIRRSPLPPRAGEITFADRFSLAVIDAGTYLNMDEREKDRVAEDFYNDTYLTDQNACTSPRMVVWMECTDSVKGKCIGYECVNDAKTEFWGRLHKLVEKKYTFQSVQGVSKLTSSCLVAAAYAKQTMCSSVSEKISTENEASPIAESGVLSIKEVGVKIEPHADNLLVRVKVPRIMDGLMELKDNSGYFFEYDCADILELKGLCDDKRCQTFAYIGDKGMLIPLLNSGVRGIDRVTPVGKTMDFDLVWDGYNLYERLTRTISLT